MACLKTRKNNCNLRYPCISYLAHLLLYFQFVTLSFLYRKYWRCALLVANGSNATHLLNAIFINGKFVYGQEKVQLMLVIRKALLMHSSNVYCVILYLQLYIRNGIVYIDLITELNALSLFAVLYVTFSMPFAYYINFSVESIYECQVQVENCIQHPAWEIRAIKIFIYY